MPHIRDFPTATAAHLCLPLLHRIATSAIWLIAAVVGALWWLGFHRHARWTSWFLGALPFAVVLFFFFYYLERVLPANY